MLVITISAILSIEVTIAGSFFFFGIADYVEIAITDSLRDAPMVILHHPYGLAGSIRPDLQRLRTSILRFYASRPLVLEATLNVLRFSGLLMMLLAWSLIGEVAGLLFPTRILLGVACSLPFFSDYRGALRLERRIERDLERDRETIRQIRELEPRLQERYHRRLIDLMLQRSKEPTEDLKNYIAFLLGPDGPSSEVVEKILRHYAEGQTEIARLAQQQLEEHFQGT